MAGPVGYSPISSESRVRILALLADRSERTIDELAVATGLHANTVREHLQRLVDSGFVLQETEHRTTRGRPRALYRAVTGEDGASSPIIRQKARDAAERGDLMRRVLPETLSATLTAEEMHQLDAIVEHLEETGFEPLIDDDAMTIDLSPCAHVARPSGENDRCRVHLSLLETVLTESGSSLRIDSMRDTCDPRDCVIQLLRRRPA